MNVEERLHRMMSNVGGDVAEGAWTDFLSTAHRRHTRYRVVTAFAIVAAVVAAGVGTAAVLNMEGNDLDLMPADRNIVPAPIPVDVPTGCPTPGEVDEGSLGTVAYLGATELHVVDVATGHDEILVQGGPGFGEGFFAGEVRISPDGRWVSFGEGLMVPTAGGEVCAPLGQGVQDLQWTPDGRAVALNGGSLTVGGPGLVANKIHDDFVPRFESFVMSPDGQRAAAAVSPSAHETDRSGIWVVDISSEEVVRLTRTTTDPAGVVIAGWDPKGRWVLFWNTYPNSESAHADGSPLRALNIDSDETVELSDGMPRDRGQVASCDGFVVIADVPGRLAEEGHVITILDPADWTSHPLPGDEGESYVDPSCGGDEAETLDQIVATAAPGAEATLGEVEKQTSIVWLDPHSGEVFNRTAVPGRISRFPVMSPSGYVVFEARERGASEGELYLYGTYDQPINPLDGELTRLAEFVHVDDYPYLGGTRSWDWHQP